MSNILDSLTGKKTAITTGAIAVLSALSGLGLIHIDPAKLQAILTLLGAGAAYGIHSAVVRQGGSDDSSPSA